MKVATFKQRLSLMRKAMRAIYNAREENPPKAGTPAALADRALNADRALQHMNDGAEQLDDEHDEKE